MFSDRGRVFDGRICFGFIVISLGIILLLNNIYPHLHLWRFVGRLWPVILIILGLLILFGRRHHLAYTAIHDSVRHNRVIGDTRMEFKGREIGNFEASQVIGDMVIDFTGGKLKQGVNHIHPSMVIGDLLILIPTAFPAKISAKILLGDIQYGSRKEHGFSPQFEHIDDNYDQSENKLFLEISGVIGDIKLQRV